MVFLASVFQTEASNNPHQHNAEQHHRQWQTEKLPDQ